MVLRLPQLYFMTSVQFISNSCMLSKVENPPLKPFHNCTREYTYSLIISIDQVHLWRNHLACIWTYSLCIYSLASLSYNWSWMIHVFYFGTFLLTHNPALHNLKKHVPNFIWILTCTHTYILIYIYIYNYLLYF